MVKSCFIRGPKGRKPVESRPYLGLKINMSKNSQNPDFYANSIIEDVRSRFVSEETTKYTDDEIERIYEFDDGAVVKYEWRSTARGANDGGFNHRFTMVKPPKPNPAKIKTGVIREIGFPE